MNRPERGRLSPSDLHLNPQARGKEIMNQHRENEIAAGSMNFSAPAGKSKIGTDARIDSEIPQEPNTGD